MMKNIRFRDACYNSMWDAHSPNNHLRPPSHMILTIDNFRFSGMVLDGVNRKTKVPISCMIQYTFNLFQLNTSKTSIKRVIKNYVLVQPSSFSHIPLLSIRCQ